jgi:hypothetical protein
MVIHGAAVPCQRAASFTTSKLDAIMPPYKRKISTHDIGNPDIKNLSASPHPRRAFQLPCIPRRRLHAGHAMHDLDRT